MILITGATGYIGQNLVQALLDQGFPVRCLVPRQPISRLPWDMEAEHAPEIVFGTILNEQALFQAMTQVHTIFHLENAFWWGRARDLERIELAGTQALVAAARSARVGRIITLSHLGAMVSSAFTLHRVKGQVEDVIRNSGLAYTIIRSGLVFGVGDSFINNIIMMMKSNPFVFIMPGRGEVTVHPIYIDDLVEALVRSMDAVDVVDEIIEIGGIEYVTLADLVATVMRVSGTRRRVVSVPPYMMRWIIYIYDLVMPRSMMTSQWLDLLATHRSTNLGSMYTYFGFQPRRFEDTLASYIREQPYFRRSLRYPFRRKPRGV